MLLLCPASRVEGLEHSEGSIAGIECVVFPGRLHCGCVVVLLGSSLPEAARREASAECCGEKARGRQVGCVFPGLGQVG